MVDGLLIGGNNQNSIVQIKGELETWFGKNGSEEEGVILDMETHRDRKQRKRLLAQKWYSQKVLEQFKMHKARFVNIALPKALGPEKRLEFELNDLRDK